MWRSQCHKPTIWDALKLPSVGHLGTVSCWVYHMKSAWIICSESPKEQPLATPRESQVPTVCGPRSCQRSKPVDDLWVDRVIARPTSRNVKCSLVVMHWSCIHMNINKKTKNKYMYYIWILNIKIGTHVHKHMLCHVMLTVLLSYVMLSYVMLCFVMLCYVCVHV